MLHSTRRFYHAVRNWVDGDLKEMSARGRILVPPPLIIGAAFGIGEIFPAQRTAILIAAMTLVAAWIGFILWRALRMVKAASAHNDRVYDRKNKYALPPDYADTESETAAKQKRKTAEKSYK